MILGIGIDLVDIFRINKILENTLVNLLNEFLEREN